MHLSTETVLSLVLPTVTTLLGITFAVVTYFNWTNIRKNVAKTVRRVAKSELEAIEKKLADTNRAYAEYLLAVQNINDPTQFEATVTELLTVCPSLWNFQVYAAQKHLQPVLLRQTSSLFRYAGLSDVDYAHIMESLRILDDAEKHPGNNDVSATGLWLGLAHALLREPFAALRYLRSIGSRTTVRQAYPWVDVFWGMSAKPNGEMFAQVAEIFDLGPTVSRAKVQSVFEATQVRDGYFGATETPRAYFVGAHLRTGRSGLITLIRFDVPGRNPQWRVLYPEHSDEGSTVGSGDAESCEQAWDLTLSKYTGVCGAPPELWIPWQRAQSRLTEDF